MSPRKHKNETAKELRDSDVDGASAASFPANDPPPWTLGSGEPAIAPPPPLPAAPLSVASTLSALGTQNAQAVPTVPADFEVAMNEIVTVVPTSADVRMPAALPRRSAGRHTSWWQRVDTVTLARLQGGYFAVTGVWPLLHMRSFRYVTGGKKPRERWLVKTVGVLVASIGTALLASTANRRRPDPAIRLLATTSALGLLAIDLWYAARRRIAPVYLLDAAAEVALAVGWSRARAPAARTSF